MVRLFRVSLPANALALIAADAVLVMFCYVAPLYFTIDVAPRVYLLEDGGIWRVILVTAVILLGLYFHDLYENYRIRSRILLVQNICMILGFAFVLQALLSYGRWNLLLPKWDMVYGSGLLLILLTAWRLMFSSAVSQTVGAQKVLFLGGTPAAREIMTHLAQRPELGLNAVGWLSDEPPGDASADSPAAGSDVFGIPCLGPLTNLDAALEQHRPDRVIVTMSERPLRVPLERLLELRSAGIQIDETARAYEYVLHRVSTRDLRLSDLIFSPALVPPPHQMLIRSSSSWILAALLAVLTLPVMLIVALLVKLTSPGPVLLRQTRTGFNGVPFELYKFRSMYRDAEAQTGAVWSKKDDPRITPVGRWLRRLRLDELPQLFNVLRGEMSLVGPRPERPEFVQLLQAQIPFYLQRHCVKPGITGWAQINHGYTDSVDDAIVKLEYDLYYIKNFASSLDLFILFHTFKTMVSGRGAQ